MSSSTPFFPQSLTSITSFTLSNLPSSTVSVQISTPTNVLFSSASIHSSVTDKRTSLPVPMTSPQQPPLEAAIQSCVTSCSTASRKLPIKNVEVQGCGSKILSNVAQPSRNVSNQDDHRSAAQQGVAVFRGPKYAR